MGASDRPRCPTPDPSEQRRARKHADKLDKMAKRGLSHSVCWFLGVVRAVIVADVLQGKLKKGKG